MCVAIRKGTYDVDTFGGLVKRGEDPWHAAKREFKEETDYRLDRIERRCNSIYEYDYVHPNGHITRIYVKRVRNLPDTKKITKYMHANYRNRRMEHCYAGTCLVSEMVKKKACVIVPIDGGSAFGYGHISYDVRDCVRKSTTSLWNSGAFS